MAAQVRPAAEIVVDRLQVRPGEMVVDVGCGTGNAAFIAARRGAQVTGVDPSPRMLELARAGAAAAGLEIQFVDGDAAAMPIADKSVDAIASVFGVIFAPDADAAAAEMSRVLRPGGRIALSAWLREGALAEQARMRNELVVAAGDEGPSAPPFDWHDPAVLTDLLAPYRFSVEVEPHELAFTGPSPEEYADGQLSDHPLWVEAREVVEPERWEQASRDLTRMLTEANEDPDAFRVTSRYVVATATRTE